MLNKVMLIGNLGRDPEIRHTQAGKAIGTFSVATSERWKDRDGNRQERTEWHRVVCFSEGLVNNVIDKYLKKGSRVYIEGQLQTRKWQDQSGQDRYTTEVVLQQYGGQLILLGGNESRGGGDPDPDRTAGIGEDLDDEIPF